MFQFLCMDGLHFRAVAPINPVMFGGVRASTLYSRYLCITVSVDHEGDHPEVAALDPIKNNYIHNYPSI